MRFWIPTIALAAVTVLVLLAMRRAWRRREETTTAEVGELPAVPVETGAALTGAFEATYVGSTRSGRWLERLTGQGLGVRAHGTVQLFETGLLVVREGTEDLFLPARTIDGARLDRGLAGEVSDPRRLLVVTWRAGTDIDSGFLLRSQDHAQQLVSALTGAVQEKEAG